MTNVQEQSPKINTEPETPAVPTKPTHTIVLDSTPLLLNTPPLSTLLANSTVLVTTPSVISEIRDLDARTRIETLYLPFVSLRQPKLQSLSCVKQFAQKTGDAAVLSKTDFEILALAYELECERNEGDWRLRSVPGQKKLNGSPPKKDRAEIAEEKRLEEKDIAEELELNSLTSQLQASDIKSVQTETDAALVPEDAQQNEISSEPSAQQPQPVPEVETTHSNIDMVLASEDLSSDSDAEGWITPSNIKRHQAKDTGSSTSAKSETRTLQVATITGDFAMQNVLLQMNLNLLSPATCKRIANIKQTILRCHGCFATTKDMTKQFCPRCGNPTLTRVSCTTNDRGEVKLHLKANMQWNNKGNIFSIPKPVAGSANQKWKGPRQGGGQSGWGNELILAEDQKEYIRAMSNNQRNKKKDLMDEDYLPNILTGDRSRAGGRIRVGAGRSVNAKKN